MTQRTETAAIISRFAKDKFPLAVKREVSEDTPLLESGIVDSMGILEIVAFLEQEFSIQVSDEDLTPENFASIKCLAAFVAAKSGLVAQEALEGPVCEPKG